MRDDTLRAAPFFPRAAAYLLDRLILAAVLFLPRLITAFRASGADALSRAVLFRYTWADILFWAVGCAYFVLFTALAGATPGKKAMGLTVVNSDGGRCDLMTVLCRETWGRYLSSLMCIGYILCAVDHERGALHDRICDTRVVYATAKAAPVQAVPAVRSAAPLPALPSDDWYAPNMERR